jgi:hypothetical protein
MKPEGKIQVLVRSRKVPVGTFLRTEPVYSTSGLLVGYTPITRVLYATSLDQAHRKTIEEAQKLASSLGLGLEVVDESRSGIFARLFSRLNRNGSRYPSVVVSPPMAKATSETSLPLPNGC